MNNSWHFASSDPTGGITADSPERVSDPLTPVDPTVAPANQHDRVSLRHLMKRRVFDPSAVATDSAVRVITAFFYLMGGLAALLGTSFDDPTAQVNEEAIRLIGFSAIVLSVMLLLRSSPLPKWSVHVFVLLGIALTSVAVLNAGSSSTAVIVAACYTFVVVDVSIFFGPLGMVIYAVVCSAAVSAVLTNHGIGIGPIVALHVIAIALALVVAWLARISSSAQIDQLTKLLNRHGFETRLETALSDAELSDASVAVVLLDIDRFRSINTRFGRNGGDDLLKAVARRWTELLGESGWLARLGGDDFAVLLNGYAICRAAELADELRAALPDGVTASAGVSTWRIDDTASMIMGRAEAALYDAKTGGRDKTAIHGAASRIVVELESAITNGELFLEYQPVVSLADGSVVSYEALLRWNHPTKGVIPPLDFIPQQQPNEVTNALSNWVINQACQVMSAAREDHRRIRVAVNASMAELANPDYIEIVSSAVALHGISPWQLTIEVTEAFLDEDDIEVASTLGALRGLGVSVAIDDFGSGYSSLRWLDRFPVDILKIDKAFVERITDRNQQTPVLEGIIRIARTLNLSVIVEGIETETQASVLRRVGADLVQGFLFSPPVSAPHGRLAANSIGQSIGPVIS